MSYISLSDKDKKEMLAGVGASSPEDLFKSIPEYIRLKKGLCLPPSLAEPELVRHFEELGRKNAYSQYLSFLGAGAYSNN